MGTMKLFNTLLIILLFVSCGKPDNKCIGRQEAILRCQADVVQSYHPGVTPEFLLTQCENQHPVESCY
jgi:hypothetical protein